MRMLGTANSGAGKQRHRRERERSQLLGECLLYDVRTARHVSLYDAVRLDS